MVLTRDAAHDENAAAQCVRPGRRSTMKHAIFAYDGARIKPPILANDSTKLRSALALSLNPLAHRIVHSFARHSLELERQPLHKGQQRRRQQAANEGDDDERVASA